MCNLRVLRPLKNPPYRRHPLRRRHLRRTAGGHRWILPLPSCPLVFSWQRYWCSTFVTSKLSKKIEPNARNGSRDPRYCGKSTTLPRTSPNRVEEADESYSTLRKSVNNNKYICKTRVSKEPMSFQHGRETNSRERAVCGSWSPVFRFWIASLPFLTSWDVFEYIFESPVFTTTPQKVISKRGCWFGDVNVVYCGTVQALAYSMVHSFSSFGVFTMALFSPISIWYEQGLTRWAFAIWFWKDLSAF